MGTYCRGQWLGDLSDLILHPLLTYSVAAGTQKVAYLRSNPGRPSSVIHQMKAKNIRLQKLNIGFKTEKLYKLRYCTVSMAII